MRFRSTSFLFATAFGLAGVYETRRHRHPLDPLIAALAVIVAVLVVDTVLGAPLQFNSALGYSPKVAGRFAGLGNLGYAALTASALILAALLANRIGGRRGLRVAVGLLAVVFVVDAAPQWGADVGGILSVLPAFVVMAYLLLGLRMRLRTVVLWLGATLLAVVGFGLLDLARPSDQRTHLGRLFERMGSDGWSGLQTVIERKANANLETIGNSVWLWVLPMVGAFVVYLVVRRRPLVHELFRRIPELRAAAVGFAILTVLGYALNDSGIAVPGMMIGIANAALVGLLVWVLREPSRPDPQPGAVPGPRVAPREPVGAAMTVVLGLLVGALTVLFLRIAGRSMLAAPALQRRELPRPHAADRRRHPHRARGARRRSRARRPRARSASATTRASRSRAAKCCSACSASAFLGLLDDLLGTGADRGFRGHLRAVTEGRITTGFVKLFGGAGVAVRPRRRPRGSPPAAGSSSTRSSSRSPPTSGTSSTARRGARSRRGGRLRPAGDHRRHRPDRHRDRAGDGRVRVAARRPRRAPHARRHRRDVLGAVLGLGVVLGTSSTTRTVVLVALILLNIAAEVVSFSRVIERVGPLRAFDRLGRRPARRRRPGSGAQADRS